MVEKTDKLKGKYRALLEGSSNGIYMFQDGRFKFVNERLVELSGYSREELKNLNFLDLVHPDYREDIKEWTKQASTGDISGLPKKYEFEALRKDGSSIWVRLTPSLIEHDGRFAIVGNVSNITESKRLQEKEEFLHSLLRHDVWNKAQIAQGYLELIEDYNLPEEIENYLSKAKGVTKDEIEIIEKVRKLRGVGEERLKDIKIGTILGSVVANKRARTSERGIELEADYSEREVLGGKLLEELFTNLIENSIRHAQCNKIKISCRETEDDYIVGVEDDGKGVPNEMKDKIFEKRFKEGEASGSGLGLYLVKEIAESYGGSVKVKDSELGGARFDVHLKKA